MYRFNSFTQKANDVLNLAIKAAENFGHTYIGTEHILIGVLKENTKKKGFVNATADLTLISLVKTKESYSIMPTFNDYEKGPLCIDDDERILSLQYKEGELFEHIHDIIMVYMKANVFYKEKQIAEERKKSSKIKQENKNNE